MVIAPLYIAAEKSTAAPVVLYAVGFALQVIGGVLIAREIRNDLRAARRIAAQHAWENIDSFPAFVGERLSRRLWPRVVGLTLLLLGAAVGLAANLLALS
jgi:hypothetical protein